MQRRDPLRGQAQLQGSQAREPMTRDLPMDPLMRPSWPPSGCSLPSPTGRLNLNPNPEPQGPFSKTISNIVTLTRDPAIIMSSPRSPKRRKILSSINPTNDGHDKDDHPPRAHRSRDHRRSRSRSPPPRRNTPDRDPPTTHTQDEATDTAPTTSHDNDAPRVTKFRFKSHSSHRSSHRSSRRRSRSRSRTRHRDDPDTTTRRHRRHHQDDDPSRPRRHHHRRHRSPSPAPAPAPQQDPDDPFSAPPLDRDAAFRESLFDAMADDEGAAYWESVYGQPIHVYGPGPSSTSAGGPLERMTEDEYAAHVRQKMWEKTHAGLIEERARREQARLAKDEELRAGEAERARIRGEMERSLRRGEERRRRRGWEGYLGRWKAWGGDVEGIPWPVVGVGAGREEAVRAFFVEGLGLEEVGEREFAARLKEERVRWHPDKMQQRLGGTVEEGVMKEVTATFQVIEGLWNDTRGK